MMPRVNPNHDRKPDETADEFALVSHQLGAVRDPRASIHAVIAEKQERFVGRPYFIWRNDPELARKLNDTLAASKD
jgi:hypothetical protein